jgi:Na+/H+ antiporter NhaC
MEHTKTQLVYAVTVAAISLVAGYLLAGLGVNVWLTLAVGIAMNVGVFALFGKNPEKTEA